MKIQIGDFQVEFPYMAEHGTEMRASKRRTGRASHGWHCMVCGFWPALSLSFWFQIGHNNEVSELCRFQFDPVSLL